MTNPHIDPAQPTALYRFYDANDSLLYVGISQDPDARAKQHAETAADSWWPKAKKRTLEWIDDRTEAETAEAHAIKTERPRFNQRHSSKYGPELWEVLNGRDSKKREGLLELAGGQRPVTEYGALTDHIAEAVDSEALKPGQKIPTAKQYARRYGLSHPVVQRALGDLAAKGYLERRAGTGYFVLPPADRTVTIPVGRPAKAAEMLRQAMTPEQIAQLIEALSDSRFVDMAQN